jgi:FkbM family methyltransferase
MTELKILDVKDIEEIEKIERFVSFEVKLLDTVITAVDSASFVSSYRSIFSRKIYQFRADTDTPLIIDGGANIGLSVIFFKKLYPKARVIAFEPDPKICKVLRNNLAFFGYDDVVLHEKALWTDEAARTFMSEGADGGRIAVNGDTKNIIKVKTMRLSEFITEPVDFLKLDIEGAEMEVLSECYEKLPLVKNIFVEYHSFLKQEQCIDRLFKCLKDAGFRIHVHHGGISLQPYMGRHINVGMDLQLNIFGFRP